MEKMKFNAGATRHFNHGCQLFAKFPLEIQVSECKLYNQAWNWIQQKKGRPLVEFKGR